MDDSLAIGNVFSKYSGTYTNGMEVVDEEDGGSYMDFDSYLKLMVAQMSNQDFNDPMDDSEVLAQMAQYSMLDGIKTMTQQANISYSTSLVGKVVTVDGPDGIYMGKVESVTVTNGKAQLIVDGMAYDSDTVTDIVSEEMFNNLTYLIGGTAYKRGGSTEENLIGKITNVVYYGGTGYVIVNGKEYDITEINVVIDPNDGSTEGTEGTGTEGTGSTETGSAENTVTETSEVQTAEAAAAYGAKTSSNSAIVNFIKELDGEDGVSGVSASSETNSLGGAFEEFIVETVDVRVPDYAAGAYADGSVINDTIYPTDTYGSGSGTLTADSNDVKLGSSYFPEYSTGAVQYTASGKPRGVTTAKGISESDCVPHRISVEDYPEEAALADELGTRMYDIRFINNRAITSRINTDEVIGHTVSGKAITEIGYSGVGQLGEVVTFADGTQRVEVLLKSGESCWLYTSGNYTLDEICVKVDQSAPGSLAGKLTPEESVIRHFSDPASETGKALREQFARQIRYTGV